MTAFTSSHRYIKRYVKTAYVDIWVPGRWETIKGQAFWIVFNTHGNITEKIKCALAMNGKRRAWFTNVYLIFDPYVVDKSGDAYVLGVMAEADFLVHSLAISISPTNYVPRAGEVSTAFINEMCKRHIRSC